jgi:hypothetical protein
LPGGDQSQPVTTSPNASQPTPKDTSAQVGSLRTTVIAIIAMPIAVRTENVHHPDPNEMRVGSISAMIAPRVRMFLSIDQASTPLMTRRSMLIASDVPARNTNVGAHRWVSHRVKNSPAGSAIVVASAYHAESWSM